MQFCFIHSYSSDFPFSMALRSFYYYIYVLLQSLTQYVVRFITYLNKYMCLHLDLQTVCVTRGRQIILVGYLERTSLEGQNLIL